MLPNIEYKAIIDNQKTCKKMKTRQLLFYFGMSGWCYTRLLLQLQVCCVTLLLDFCLNADWSKLIAHLNCCSHIQCCRKTGQKSATEVSYDISLKFQHIKNSKITRTELASLHLYSLTNNRRDNSVSMSAFTLQQDRTHFDTHRSGRNPWLNWRTNTGWPS